MSQQQPAPAPEPQGDWAAQVADTIERLVGQVRERTTTPVVKIARGVVFGLLAAVLGLAALILVAIIWVRLLSYLPGGIWVAHFITGLIFLVAGIVAMVKRHAPTTEAV